MRVVVIITLLFALSADTMLAQPEPQGVMVTPDNADFTVEVVAEKPNFLAGERLSLNLRLSQGAFVYVYSINAKGEVQLLFPNAYAPNNWMEAGQHKFPSNRYSLVIDGDPGTEVIQAVATQTPLNLLALIQTALTTENPFAYVDIKPEHLVAEFQQLITQTNGPNEWAAAWTQFQIVTSQPHRWIVESFPSELKVFLDGEMIGLTPEEINLEAPSRASQTRRVELALVNVNDEVVWVGTLTLSTNASGELRIKTQTQGNYHDLDVDTDGNLTKLKVDARPPSVTNFGNNLDVDPVEEPDFDSNGSINYQRLGSLGGSLSANLGGHPDGISTFGFEFGIGFLRVGVGLADTVDANVPEFFDIGRPEDLGPTTVFNADPEIEFYGKLSLSTGIEGVFLEFGGGIVMQEQAHVAAPFGSNGLDVGVLPNGYTSEVFTTAGIAGLAYRVGGLLLQIGYDTHRGVVGGLGVVF